MRQTYSAPPSHVDGGALYVCLGSVVGAGLGPDDAPHLSVGYAGQIPDVADAVDSPLVDAADQLVALFAQLFELLGDLHQLFADVLERAATTSTVAIPRLKEFASRWLRRVGNKVERDRLRDALDKAGAALVGWDAIERPRLLTIDERSDAFIGLHAARAQHRANLDAKR